MQCFLLLCVYISFTLSHAFTSCFLATSSLCSTFLKIASCFVFSSTPPSLTALPPCRCQVLTSDELTGSLRQLKPCFLVARERFKSLQKRGAIEVRKRKAQKGQGRRVVYEKGARREKAEDMQQQTVSLRKHRVELERAAAGKKKK